ncbi:hypothetical protein B0H14DRAFT_269497 [Mycena olivaceomarginata]|nr:hypothetical protein B0H14DRAFT_269497 [Mycena olivaceomarginata]
MLGFLSFWRQDDAPALPSHAAKRQGRRVDKAAIGRPVLRAVPRRFEIYAPADYIRDPLARSTSHRSGSLHSHCAPPSPATAHSTPSGRDKPPSGYPLIRSYSLPTPVPSSPSGSTGSTGSTVSSFGATPAARANSFSPLHLDIHRPLSPILEICVSPISIKPTSPKDDISSLDLQRTKESSLFVQRTPTSERMAVGPIPAHAPSLPPLNMSPYFPGPHPSEYGDGPPRRPPRVLARNTVHSEGATRSSTGSLHAESFVTASESMHTRDAAPADVLPLELTSSVNRSTSSTIHGSHCEPFPVRLERQGTAVSGGASSTLRLKRQHFEFATPAFCAFWLGFLFPLFWWIGGWYFTFFPETPASRTLWQHYVLDTQWYAALTCGGRRRNRLEKGRASRPVKPLLLPQWVGRSNTTASLKGISYYYPYVSRPAPGEKGHVTTSPPPRGFRHLHRFFDEMTRSRLAKVKLNHESPRRIIDPWIQRCRRALCYFCLLLFLFVLGMMGWSFAVGAGKTHY